MGMGNIEYLTSIVIKEMQVLTRRGPSALTKLVKIKSNDSGGGAGDGPLQLCRWLKT